MRHPHKVLAFDAMYEGRKVSGVKFVNKHDPLFCIVNPDPGFFFRYVEEKQLGNIIMKGEAEVVVKEVG